MINFIITFVLLFLVSAAAGYIVNVAFKKMIRVSLFWLVYTGIYLYIREKYGLYDGLYDSFGWGISLGIITFAKGKIRNFINRE